MDGVGQVVHQSLAVVEGQPHRSYGHRRPGHAEGATRDAGRGEADHDSQSVFEGFGRFGIQGIGHLLLQFLLEKVSGFELGQLFGQVGIFHALAEFLDF
jgi:hypothetical protein